MKMDAVEDEVCNRRQYANPGNFAMIAKISLGLRTFRSHSEYLAILAKLRNFAILAKLRNFAILAKLRNFARQAKFRYIAKITVPRENLQFLYL